tara:strand:+ start:7284 stop:7508 length:225 start_codon:yes stop_codon:yes gene_type:complete
MEKQRNSEHFIASSLIGAASIVGAIYLLVENISLVGMNLYRLQPTVTTWASALLFGVVFLIVSYYLYSNRNLPK